MGQPKSVNVYIVFTNGCVHMENMRLPFTELVMFVSFLVINPKTSKAGIAMIFLYLNSLRSSSTHTHIELFRSNHIYFRVVLN